MRRTWWLLCLAACADGKSPLPLGSKDSPLRAICDASPSLLARELALYCGPMPPSPTGKHPLYWSGALPCSSSLTYLPNPEGPPTVTYYDYSKPYEEPSSTYDGDGNLLTWTALDFGFIASVTLEYADGRYVGASFGNRHYAAVYDGNFRVAEGAAGETMPSYYWTYEDDQLVAEGPPVHGGAPQRYAESMLDADAQGNLPFVPLLEPEVGSPIPSASIARKAYFYDDDGRVRKVGVAGVPGASMNRIDLSYEADRLTTIVLSQGASREPSLASQRIEYSYCE